MFAAEKDASSAPGPRWCIATPTLRIRALPSTDGEIIDKIPYGVQVHVLGERSEEQTIGRKTGRWVEVQFHGKHGYAFDAFLSEKEPTVTIKGIEKKTAALVNSVKQQEDHCSIEFVDAAGTTFVETARSADVCRRALLGKRVKLLYTLNKACTHSDSCPKIILDDLQVLPFR